MSHPPTPAASAIADPSTTATGGKPYTAPRKQIWGWAAGRVAEFSLISTFGHAMNIFTVGFGLNPVIVSWCMMLPRLVDGLVDPMMGHWSDNMKGRWGRRKPFMVGGGFIGAIFLILMWWANPAWNSTTQFLYLLGMATCLYVCYGAFVMSWTAIGYELSDDYHERSKVAAIGGFFLAIMGLANSWVYWFALRPAFGGVIWGMRWVAMGLAGLVVVFTIITVLLTKERFTHTNERKHEKLGPAIKETLKNRAFVYLLLMKIAEIFGGRLTGGISFYLGMYYVCQGDQNLSTALGGIGATLGMVWNFGMLPLVKPASKLIGKRGALITSTAIGLMMAIIAPFITTPAHPYWGLIPGLIVAPLLVITGTIAGAILPDICDVDELEHGQRREGLFTSVMSFVSKLEISLAVVLVGYVVSWSSIDTSITRRWDAMIDGKKDAVTDFVVGEKSVFTFKQIQSTEQPPLLKRMFRVLVPPTAESKTFDTVSILIPETDKPHLGGVKLWVSDESPTQGFRSVGEFKPEKSGAGVEVVHFAPVTAKYVKMELMAAPEVKKVDLTEIEITNSAAAEAGGANLNLIAAENGGRVVASQPPDPIVGKLYWLVMIPSVIFAAVTFLMTLLFPLTEAKMLEVRRKLDERRMAKAAAGEPTDEVAEEFVHDHPRQAAQFVQQHPDIIAEVEAENDQTKSS